jgi:YHS domain-containing protein
MLIRLLIFIVAAVVIHRAIKRWMIGHPNPKAPVSGHAPVQVDDEMIKDPVCGSYFPKRDAVTLENNGQQVKFCSQKCRDRYIERHAGS